MTNPPRRTRRSHNAALLTGALALLAGSGLSLAQDLEPVPTQTVSYANHVAAMVTPINQAQVALVRSLGGRLIAESDGVGVESQWVLPQDTLGQLDDAGVAYSVLDFNVQRMIESEREAIAQTVALEQAGRNIAWFQTYKNRAQIETYLDDLIAAHPNLISEQVVGQSINGTDILGYTITSPVNGPASAKPAIAFNNTIHAREWVSPMTGMYVIDQLVSTYGIDPVATEALDELTFYVIPVLNPDGFDYAWTTDRLWRKNRRNNGDGTWGVDLNRNFPVGFGGAGTSSSGFSDIYHGAGPFSEPESQTLRDYIQARPNIKAYIDYHSYGELILWPIGYTTVEMVPEPDRSILQNLSFDMRDAILAETGRAYVAQNSADLYPAGGVTQDWAYEDEGIFAWTIELRPASAGSGGFLLPEDQILPTGRENYKAVLSLAQSVIEGVQWVFPSGLPTTVDAETPATISFDVQPLFGETLDDATATLHYRVGSAGAFNEVAASVVAPGAYSATLPGQPCGADVDFYFTVATTTGEVFRSPDAASATNTLTAAAQTTVAQDDMTSDSGWTVGATGDTAFTGIWELANPAGTIAQPENDHSATNDTCWVTGALAGPSAGAYDLDGGATSLITPAYDLSDADDAVVRYWRWFSNDAGGGANEDVFRVFASNDDGSTWSLLEEVGPSGPDSSGGWVLAEIQLSNAVPTSSTVRLKFVAEDAGNPSLVEAAIDDLELVALGTCEPCQGDATGDGNVGTADLLVLLGAWGNNVNDGAASGDFDNSGTVGTADLLILLSAWGTAC